MFTTRGCRRRNPDAFTTIRLQRLLEQSVALLDESEIPTVDHDFTEPDMSHSFAFDFEQVPLVVGTDAYLNGTADLQYDAAGDWSIVGIALDSSEIDGHPVHVDRSGMLYQHIASRIELHCRHEIDNAVHDVMVERRDEGRHLLAAE